MKIAVQLDYFQCIQSEPPYTAISLMAQARSPVLNRHLKAASPWRIVTGCPLFFTGERKSILFFAVCFYEINPDLATLIDKPVATKTRDLSDFQDRFFPHLFVQAKEWAAVWEEKHLSYLNSTLLQSVSFSELVKMTVLFQNYMII